MGVRFQAGEERLYFSTMSSGAHPVVIERYSPAVVDVTGSSRPFYNEQLHIYTLHKLLT
jgi:hypothetical protein